MTIHSLLLSFAAVLFSLTQPVLAANSLPGAASTDPIRTPATCHLLMTELECGLHKTTLAQLSSGPLRDRYLAAHTVLIQEREAACNCNRKIVTNTPYPSRRQALLSF